MIVGCYSLDLYCDHNEAREFVCHNWPGQWAGRTRQDCLRQARQDGWVVQLDTDPHRCFCPKHAKSPR